MYTIAVASSSQSHRVSRHAYRHARAGLVAAALVFGSSVFAAQAHAQAPQRQAPKPNWFNLDLQADSNFGIGMERAYKELLAGKKPKTVIVGIVDAGVDTTHEDLKAVLWTNPKEKGGNGIDDDKNGYADDMHGWSFIGSKKGSIHYDNLEVTRLIRKLKPKYGAVTDTMTLSVAQRDTLRQYKAMEADFNTQLEQAQGALANMNGFAKVLNGMVTNIGKPAPTAADFEAYAPQTQGEAQIRMIMMNQLKNADYATFKAEALDKSIEHVKEQVDYNLNLSYDPRSLVGDDTNNVNEKLYGTSDVDGPDPDHGTHVAGIIGAVRTNNIGIKGVADCVQLMAVRAVPEGDERDKDIANAIRYAVDNGAKVINMSFGKAYSPDKATVDAAVKYAMSKDVLLIHAAGNDNKNLDEAKNFPTRVYADGSGQAAAWIEVGASGWTDDNTLKAPFSNYGKTTVDVFAPGERINSTTPGSKYADHDGTSMAAPVVAGLAAVIRGYYPQLTAVQVKEIIMKSVVPITHDVLVPMGQQAASVPFSSLCITGGVVNAYKALQLAATYK
jgi:subtilisin family serine protease